MRAAPKKCARGYAAPDGAALVRRVSCLRATAAILGEQLSTSFLYNSFTSFLHNVFRPFTACEHGCAQGNYSLRVVRRDSSPMSNRSHYTTKLSAWGKFFGALRVGLGSVRVG